MSGALRGTDHSEHVERLLRDDEELRWYAKPDKKAFYATSAVGGLVAAGFLAGFFGIPGAAVLTGLTVFLFSEQAVVWVLGGFATLLAVGIPAGLAAATVRQYRLREFAVTDDRVIKVSGLFGRDSSTASLADIRDVDVSVGLFDKLFGTGTLEFQVAGGSDSGVTFKQVPAPYVTLQQIEEDRHEAEQSLPEARAEPVT